jgi:two-component system chemotaxis sensor kinase CheA
MAEPLQALVYAKDGRRIGIVVDRILDTIEERLADLGPATRHGVAGTLVIQNRVTEILDFDALCADTRFDAIAPAAGGSVAA